MGRTSLFSKAQSHNHKTMHCRRLTWLLALCTLMCAVHSSNTKEMTKSDLASSSGTDSGIGMASASKSAQTSATASGQAAYRRRKFVVYIKGRFDRRKRPYVCGYASWRNYDKYYIPRSYRDTSYKAGYYYCNRMKTRKRRGTFRARKRGILYRCGYKRSGRSMFIRGHRYRCRRVRYG